MSKIKKSSLVGYARIGALIKACFNASNEFYLAGFSILRTQRDN
jgi:hypothetical protein